jgi:hypothetical protein
VPFTPLLLLLPLLLRLLVVILWFVERCSLVFRW